ncbi:sodium-dependent bicarbonate transport family permease [Flavobacteriaceae bacterium]|nr:sodium-dependent bicarbonate transport family permease [Flavobacteriaceae bacterium]
MNLDLLLTNITNPALLFFLLGIIAVLLKSDLNIPESTSKFISLYLLFSIGFKGGQELVHSDLGLSVVWILSFGVFLALIVPLYTFFILKKKLGNSNAGAISAAYGSVSAVTFITAIAFLDMSGVDYGGHMVAVMALMEAPSIIVGVVLMTYYNKKDQKEGESSISIKKVIAHSVTNGSVVLILGSLVIGYLASAQQAQGIAPFTTDLFKGFLAVFLLDKGIVSGKKLKALVTYGWFPYVFAIAIPLANGIAACYLAPYVTDSLGDQLLFAILAGSASYIAVPAAMKMAAPKANPGLYIPMALAITFPMNITLGIPLYYFLLT